METSQARKDAIFRKKLVDTFCNYGIYIIFLIMIIYFSVQSTGFLSLSNAITVLQLSSTLGISVVGMFFVLITVNDAQERMTKGGLYEYYQT